MAMSVVRCPFCDRRYNVTGIPSGTKVLCTSCSATLTVPATHRRARPPFWRRFVPESSSAQITVGLIGGLVVATAAVLALRQGPVPAMTADEPPPAIVRAPEQPPAPRPQGDFIVRRAQTRDEQIQDFTDSIYREFGANRFLFDHRSSSPFIIYGQRNEEKVTLPTMFDEFQRALESLLACFKAEFGEPMGEFRDVLPVVVFTSKITFDDYLRQGNNPALPPEVPGVYEYKKERVVFLHEGRGWPIEVLLHEAVHEMVHYHVRVQTGRRDTRHAWWFQEGMATYFEQFRRGPTGHVVVDPLLPSPRLPALKETARRGELQPLHEIMGMDIEEIWRHWSQPAGSLDDHERKMRFTQICYGQAWALVHFLRHGAGGKYRKLFGEYFRQELLGDGRKDVFIRLLSDRFGMELQQLQYEVEAYIKNLP